MATFAMKKREPENIPLNKNAVVCFKDVTKRFGGQIVLNRVNGELHQGEVVLLRGENGSGKTTLVNILTGTIEADFGVIDYKFGGRSHHYTFPKSWARHLNPFGDFTPEVVAQTGVGRTWQHVRLFHSLTLLDNIIAADPNNLGERPYHALFSFRKVSHYEKRIADKAGVLVGQLGLAGRGDSSADKISLGQSKRIAIARAVASGIKVLFLDEPLAGLDRAGINAVLAVLESLNKDHGVTLVIVEHVFNQKFLLPLVTTDWLLNEGRLVSSVVSPPSENGKNKHSFSLTKTGADEVQEWQLLLGGEFAIVHNEILPKGAVLTRIRRPDIFPGQEEPLLVIRGLVVRRDGQPIIGMNDEGELSGIDLTIYKGEIIVLQAPNGWGKTTLLEAISGELPLSKGVMEITGKDITSCPTSDRCQLGITLARASDNVFNSLKLDEMLRLSPGGSLSSESEKFPKQNISSLSGGQKQRLAVAAMRHNTQSSVALFDEPFAMLDREAIAEVIKYLLPTQNSASLIAIPKNITFGMEEELETNT